MDGQRERQTDKWIEVWILDGWMDKRKGRHKSV
jgi:hypothetical protein